MMDRRDVLTALAAGALAAPAGAAPTPKDAGDARVAWVRDCYAVTLDRKAYTVRDDLTLQFTLKNESGRVMYVSDGWLAPKHHEAGPGRHFEVHVKAGGTAPLYFWSGVLTEGETSGIRKVFKLM